MKYGNLESYVYNQIETLVYRYIFDKNDKTIDFFIIHSKRYQNIDSFDSYGYKLLKLSIKRLL